MKKLDLKDATMDNPMLDQAKTIEKKAAQNPLVRVPIRNGYVLTTCPEKWKHLEQSPGAVRAVDF